jgi:hypothetical protein
VSNASVRARGGGFSLCIISMAVASAAEVELLGERERVRGDNQRVYAPEPLEKWEGVRPDWSTRSLLARTCTTRQSRIGSIAGTCTWVSARLGVSALGLGSGLRIDSQQQVTERFDHALRLYQGQK